MKGGLKIVLPAMVLLAGIGFVLLMVKNRREVQPAPRAPSAPLVRVLAVEPQSHRFIVRAQGTVKPHTEAYLAAEVAGKVESVSPSFVPGGFFEQGELLVQLDSRDYELAVVRSKAALAEADVRLRREQAEASVARKEWQSLGRGEANPLLLREPQLAEAEAAVASAKANLALAELELERCQIKAPFAGRISEKSADTGQFVGKGEKIARIYAVDYAEVPLPLPLDELAYLDLPIGYRDQESTGTNPPVILRAQLGASVQEWKGTVVRTEGEIDPRTRMLTVVARVEDPFGRRGGGPLPLAPGLFVHAEIMGRDAGQVIIAPRAAMRGTDRILVVDAESRLRFRPVDVIRFEKDQAILAGGLSVGDMVCISPLDAPVDGMLVRVSGEIPGRLAPGAEEEGGL